MNRFTALFFLTLIALTSCAQIEEHKKSAKPSCYETEQYFPLLKNKRVGLIANHTSMIGTQHMLDSLLNSGIQVQAVFTPEHGFRGTADAGEKVNAGKDPKTGIDVRSLYGKSRKPTPEMLVDIDVLLFDIQDIGIRFYTYISTMHLVMEAAAEQGIPLIILDRPNPNGDYVDGPVLDTAFQSFVGMHPIPVVHGLTVGELAGMINQEGWLTNHIQCKLKVVPMKDYTHDMHYILPVKPSPNLPNQLSIRIYPSLCFFEATDFSVGRGTTFPFQVVGYPNSDFGPFQFTPKSIAGMSKHPKHENILCSGLDFRDANTDTIRFSLQELINAYSWFKKQYPEKEFFSREGWFHLLSGNDKLADQIRSGLSEEEIRNSWQPELERYKTLRKKYLLYPENQSL